MPDAPPLPFWPRHLSREMAAAYVGVSVDTFEDEVRRGHWPAGERRGAKGGRVTWDRRIIDFYSDTRSSPVAHPALRALGECEAHQAHAPAPLDGKDIIKAAVSLHGAESGIYFLVKDSEVVYVGQSVNVISRLAKHTKDPNKTFDSWHWIVCDRDKLIATEAAYIKKLRPKLNKAGLCRTCADHV